MRALSLVVLLAGCDQVFGLDDLRSPVIDARSIDVTLAMHDEDNDGLDDALDSCPNVANPGDTDSDNDGVANACDPHPGTPGDRLYYFDSFDALSPRWTKINSEGEWLVVGGALQQVNAAAAAAYLVLDDGNAELIYPSVIAQITSVNASLGVALGTTITSVGIACLVDTNGGGRFSYLDNRPDQPAGSSIAMMPPTPVEVRVEGKAAEFGAGCRAKRPGSEPLTVSSLDDDTLSVDSARVALVTTESTATLTSVAVYEFEPEP